MENIQITEDILKNDPIFSKALSLTKKDNEKADEIVKELLNICMTHLDNKGAETKTLFLALGKSLVYLSQTLCSDKEHFDKELVAANNLIIKNIYPALGSNLHDEEINKESLVTYNGEFEEENFNIRRLMMLSGSLVDYTYWKVNYNTALSEYSETEKETEKK